MLVFVSLPQPSVSGSLPSATMLFTAPLNTFTGKIPTQAIAGIALMFTLVLAVVVVWP